MLLVADRLEEPKRPHGRDIGGVGGLVEAHPDMALRGEVVDLRGANLADDPRQATSVGHVAVVENQPRRGAEGLTAEVLEALGPGRTRTPHDAVNFIALGDEELRQIGAILSGDPGDDRALQRDTLRDLEADPVTRAGSGRNPAKTTTPPNPRQPPKHGRGTQGTPVRARGAGRSGARGVS